MVGGQIRKDARHVSSKARFEGSAGRLIDLIGKWLAPPSCRVANGFTGCDPSNPGAKGRGIPQSLQVPHDLDQGVLGGIGARVEGDRAAESADPGHHGVDHVTHCEEIPLLGRLNPVAIHHPD